MSLTFVGELGFQGLAVDIVDTYCKVIFTLFVLQESDDDDCIMLAEEVGIKCPYTQKVMKFPIKNKHCGHNYEKDAIFEFISNKKGNAR